MHMQDQYAAGQDQYACAGSICSRPGSICMHTTKLLRTSLASRSYATRRTISPFSCTKFFLQSCRGHLAGAGKPSAQDLQSLCPQCGRTGSLNSSSHLEQRQRSRWRRFLSLRTLSGTSQPGIVRELVASFNSYVLEQLTVPKSVFHPTVSSRQLKAYQTQCNPRRE